MWKHDVESFVLEDGSDEHAGDAKCGTRSKHLSCCAGSDTRSASRSALVSLLSRGRVSVCGSARDDGLVPGLGVSHNNSGVRDGGSVSGGAGLDAGHIGGTVNSSRGRVLDTGGVGRAGVGFLLARGRTRSRDVAGPGGGRNKDTSRRSASLFSRRTGLGGSRGTQGTDGGSGAVSRRISSSGSRWNAGGRGRLHLGAIRHGGDLIALGLVGDSADVHGRDSSAYHQSVYAIAKEIEMHAVRDCITRFSHSSFGGGMSS